MRVMKGLEKRNGIWRVRVAIPADLRARWGKREEIASLDTADENEAIRLGAPKVADIKQRIKDMRNPATAETAIRFAQSRKSREEVYDTIRRWRREEIDRLYREYWGDEAVRADPSEASQLRYRLDDRQRIEQLPNFTSKLAEILDVAPSTSFLLKPDVREWFRLAWLDVENYRDRFARDDYNGWPDDDDAPVIPAATSSTSVQVTSAGMTISQLRDQWDAVKALEPKQKGYIRRLIEFLGDKDIAAVTPLDMDRFVIELKRFPLSKRPSDDKLPFADLIARYEGTNQTILSEATRYVWTTVFKAMFEFAVSRRLLSHNPAAAMMKKPSKDEPTRTEYSEADLDFLFTRPMFKGFDGSPNFGYRDTPGQLVVKDHKYWLPVLALHTGMRLDEIATLTKDELIERDGILAFDLTRRPLTGRGRVKNAASRRLVPVHRRLIDMGFVKWARASKDPNGYILADLKFDARDKRGSQFSKWWGLWCGANAEKPGQGIADPRHWSNEYIPFDFDG